MRREGLRREFVRQVNGLRKKQGLTIRDNIRLTYETNSQSLRDLLTQDVDYLKKEILAVSFEAGAGEHELKVDGELINLSLLR